MPRRLPAQDKSLTYGEGGLGGVGPQDTAAPPERTPEVGAQHQGAVFLTLGDSLRDGCPTGLHTTHPYEDKVIPGWL